MRQFTVFTGIITAFLLLTGFQQSGGTSAGHGGLEVAGHDGIVVEMIAVEGYTYVEIESGDESTWIAAPGFKVEKGDRVLASKGIRMLDFTSRVLGRTFPVIWFVGTVEVVGEDKVAVEPKSDLKKKKVDNVKSPVVGSIKKADGGYSLEEIFDQKKVLSGKKIKLRAKVVKSSGNIMGKQWYHVQDGTGAYGALDLIVTTIDKVEAGKIVLVTGTLGLDRDFGSGYRYDVILEEASLNVE